MRKHSETLLTPLVSVVAISYNQAEFITQTLDSIFDQDYANIELIICDDNSTDETVEIASNWLKRNSYRFNGTQLISNKSNIGVCRNFALGYSTATGDWIKPLACDDVLLPFAITSFVSTSQSSGSQLLFSQIQMFSEINSDKVLIGKFLTNRHKISLFSSPEKVAKELRVQNFLPAPGSFFSKSAYVASGGIDLRFKHLDDWPLWLNFVDKGFAPKWIPEPHVLYRISNSSVSQSTTHRPISPALYSDLGLFYLYYQKPYLKGKELWERRLFLLRIRLVFELFGNSRLAYNLVKPLQLLSPITWQKISQKFFSLK